MTGLTLTLGFLKLLLNYINLDVCFILKKATCIICQKTTEFLILMVNGGGTVKHDILTNLGKVFPYQIARCSLFCPLNQ